MNASSSGFFVGTWLLLLCTTCANGALHKPDSGAKSPSAEAVTRPRSSGEGACVFVLKDYKVVRIF